MLDEKQFALFKQFYDTLNPEQKIWLAGYINGQADALGGGAGTAVSDAPKPQVNVYYATETGNSKALSFQIVKALKSAGFKSRASAVNRLKPKDIPADQPAVFLVSTHGEGDPPETALKFFDLMKEEKAGALEGLPYVMLGLGDETYEIFCGAAKTLDAELQRLGGRPVQDMALFDVDYAAHTPKWIEDTVAGLQEQFGAKQESVPTVMLSGVSAEPVIRSGRGYSVKEPVKAEVKESIILNDTDSLKQTYHIEIAYDEDLPYACGDAAGILIPEEYGGRDEPARLYSIASSPSMHEGELHMTVALARHINEDGSEGFGLCSKYLSALKPGDMLDFYIHQNQMFNLPRDDQDAIMIGPGTGIAPFRSFVYERAERDASGRNWLFFGDQRAHCDFLYQAEWQEHLAVGTLHKIDLAFSRDQDYKVYVQNRMKENAKELMDWLENGAALYVCGAKDPMSRDVENMLTEIISDTKNISLEAANDYIGQLEEDGRYAKDVY